MRAIASVPTQTVRSSSAAFAGTRSIAAILPVRHGEESDIELAFEQARPLISSQRNLPGLSLLRSIESPSQYLLLVEWDSVEHHTDGFRASAQYQDWQCLLHHFSDPLPMVEHFAATR